MNVLSTIWLVVTVHILGCISPGPDFAITVRNALAYSRKSAIYTAIGIACGILLHTTYCALGLEILLTKLPKLFVIIRYVGGAYLFYLGIKIFIAKEGFIKTSYQHQQQDISAASAFRQGFFVNALNPKAIFFIFSLFILIAKLKNYWWSIFFIVEMTVVTGLWFMFVAYCISQPVIKQKLVKIQKPISKFLGAFLVIFGLRLWLGA